MDKATPIMVQGTHSDAGKSAIVTALCRIFKQDGHSTAPFKSQNMALNSYITVDGKEIGRAQGVQAEAAGIEATTDMNPILIKPTGEYESQIVVHGVPLQNMKAGEYRQSFFDTGHKLIKEAYDRLSDKYDCIVIEGAGSPAEINLNDRELVNMRIARLTNSPVILVGDIEKGGVFASLVGTLQLLEPADRKRVIGVIINKFRGDVSLLQPGLTWFEEYTGVPVLGVVPYVENLTIEAEDSVVLDTYSSRKNSDKDIDIAVIRYPLISNFTDVDPLFEEADCHVRYVRNAEELGEPDVVLLPGSKSTLRDLVFLHRSGLANRILTLSEKNTKIFGICGGYQMLGDEVTDDFGIESSLQQAKGLGLIPMKTAITKKKTTVLSEGIVTFQDRRIPVKGYEIHMGESIIEGDHAPFIELKDRVEGAKITNITGTYFHGIFHNDEFRELVLNAIRVEKGLAPIKDRVSFGRKREESFNHLADVVRAHLDMNMIYKRMIDFKRGAEHAEHL